MKSIIDQFRILNGLDQQLQTIRKDLERLPKELASQEEEPGLLRDQMDRRKADIVKMRVVWGMTLAEIAEAMDISPPTVERDWRFAKVWLLRQISGRD